MGEEPRNMVQQLFEEPVQLTSEVLGRLRVITIAFRGRYEARITGYHVQNSKKGFKTTKVIVIITIILKLRKIKN